LVHHYFCLNFWNSYIHEQHAIIFITPIIFTLSVAPAGAAIWCIYYTATLSRHRHKKSDYGHARRGR